MELIKIPAKKISYDSSKQRDKENVVKYICIHNTGNKGDTAVNNGKFYQKGNTRQAGAHFFIDQEGVIVRSIPMNRAAYAVGGTRYKTGGSLHNVATNFNSVSIELCDIVDKEPSEKMIKALKELISYIQKYCPNAKNIIRHYDVTGKPCPQRYVDDKEWNKFLAKIKNKKSKGETKDD